MHKAHSFCSYCGEAYAELVWPRRCGGCNNFTYVNPLPVVVALVPIDDGLLCVRRSIPPQIGWLALPGGFLDVGETWQEGCAREIFEETGIRYSADEVELHSVISPPAPDRTLLLFCQTKPRKKADLPAFVPNEEVSECVLLTEPEELAFPLHTQFLREHLKK